MFKITTRWMMAIITIISALYAYLVLAAGFDTDSVAHGLSGVLVWFAGIVGSAAVVTLLLIGESELQGKDALRRLVALCIGMGFTALALWPNELSPKDSLPLLLAGAALAAFVTTCWVVPKADVPATTDGLFFMAMMLILGASVFTWKLGFGFFWDIHPVLGSIVSASFLLLSFGGMILIHQRAGRFPVRQLIA